MHLPVLALITEDLLLIKKEYKHFTAKVLENYGLLYFAFHWGVVFFFFLIWHSCSILSVIAAAAKSPQSCPTVWPHRRKPTRLLCPWDSPGKNTGVGCHFLLQCMKVKSESEVAQSCPTLSDPMDCSLQGFSVHGIFQARVLEWGAIAFSVFSHYMALILSNQTHLRIHFLLVS